MSLPKCSHGNVPVVCERYTDFVSIDTEGACDCAVCASTSEAAIRAWAALCGAVTDERLEQMLAAYNFDGTTEATVTALEANEAMMDVARAVRDACEGKR